MEINKVHCLFEQSGTFKNEFKKLGIDAEDYDILNDFGETDHVIDLFAEIRGGVRRGAKYLRQLQGRRPRYCILPLHKVRGEDPSRIQRRIFSTQELVNGREVAL